MNPRISRAGLSLLELSLASSLFLLLSVLGFLALRNSVKVFHSSSGRDRATALLTKARQSLSRDLEMAASSQLNLSQVPPSLGGGADSDALLVLSPVDPASGQIQSKALTGGAFWMRNILYYAIVPVDYERSLGYAMAGGNDGGYDLSCPVKQLIRVEIDENPGNDPQVAASEDKLLSSPAAYLTRPMGTFSAPARRTVVSNLLCFRCQQVGNALDVDLRAVSLDDARRETGFRATQSYATGKYTLQHRFRIELKN